MGGISVAFKTGQDVDWARYVKEVEFDIAVAAIDKVSGSAKGGLRVVGIGEFGGDATTGRESSVVNRIKFTVPILFPAQVFDDANTRSHNDRA